MTVRGDVLISGTSLGWAFKSRNRQFFSTTTYMTSGEPVCWMRMLAALVAARQL